MANQKPVQRSPSALRMFDATRVAFDRDARRVSRLFLRSLSGSTENTDSRK
jgi:hypothetical protein